ncbi:MAG: hypothetical protein JSS64_07700 [Bacteroidetes bacterium]|nr:hypothetical protein [Bacteroidota bacterium]
MEDLTIFNAAYRDVKTNAVPHRNEQSVFVFTPGQTDRLNQSKYQQITTLNIQIEQQDKKAKDLRREILAFDKPSNKIIGNNEKEKAMFTPDLEEEKDHRKILVAQRKEYIEQIMTRGYIPKQPAAASTVSPQPVKTPQKRNWHWKEIRNGVATWIAGEVFMTLTQYHSLHYYRSVDNIIIRSVAFAFVLFVIHFTAHLYKKSQKHSV